MAIDVDSKHTFSIQMDWSSQRVRTTRKPDG